MGPIEIYVKLKSRGGDWAAIRSHIDSIISAAKGRGSGLTRCDWFLSEKKQEWVAILVCSGARAAQSHFRDNIADYAGLFERCDLAVDVLSGATPEVLAALPDKGLRVFEFGGGLKSATGAAQFSADIVSPVAGRIGSDHIEIYTRFEIKPNDQPIFKQLAAELVSVVKAKDPGTPRYDWFYDDANRLSVAMDTYANASAMFAHMKNCHDVHHELLQHASMVTEFLGELPKDAMQAVAKYDPYIVKFYAGLRPYSSGRLT
jgi:quinol monooxygenase YgiN